MKIEPIERERYELLFSFTDEYYIRKLKEEYADGTVYAVCDDACVGWCHLDIPDQTIWDCFVVVYVAPAYRKRGYGTMIYRWAEEKMLESGCSWWSSYAPDAAADRFALSVGFDYTNHNSYMEYRDPGEIEEPLLPDGAVIRPYRPSDYPAAPDIWSREYTRMHRELGLPYAPKEKTEDEKEQERQLYEGEHYYIMEYAGKTVGIGGLFGDASGIGMLAVDSAYQGRGLGSCMTRFLLCRSREKGTAHPCIYCETNNLPAMHVYRKAGFTEIERESTAIKSVR